MENREPSPKKEEIKGYDEIIEKFPWVSHQLGLWDSTERERHQPEFILREVILKNKNVREVIRFAREVLRQEKAEDYIYIDSEGVRIGDSWAGDFIEADTPRDKFHQEGPVAFLVFYRVEHTPNRFIIYKIDYEQD